MKRVLVPLFLVGLAAPSALAQPTKIGTFPRLAFNFAPPGARSLAMGGTFIGVADDATAAGSNPAGLIILTKPEFSAHFRTTKFGEIAEDTPAGFRGSVGESSTRPSFASIVYPTKNASFSFFYNQTANFKTSTYLESLNQNGGFYLYNIQTYNEVKLKANDVALAAAFKVGSHLAVGVSAGVRRVSLNLYGSETYADTDGDRYSDQVSTDTSDQKFYVNAGILVNPNGKLSGGLVFKKGGEFEFDYSASSDNSGPTFGVIGLIEAQGKAKLTIPDSFGGGLAYRPESSWLISADAVYVKYSDLGKTNFRLPPFAQLTLADPRRFPGVKITRPDDFENVTQFHLGAEYTFVRKTPISIRAGFYNEPDYDGDPNISSGANYVTFGGGVVLQNRLQVDAAVNLSKIQKEGLLSAVFRF